jgi:hypothetical protein
VPAYPKPITGPTASSGSLVAPNVGANSCARGAVIWLGVTANERLDGEMFIIRYGRGAFAAYTIRAIQAVRADRNECFAA